MTQYKINDLVGVASPKYAGRTFKVIKVNPTTYLLEPVDGSGRRVRASHTLVTSTPVTRTTTGTAQDVPLPEVDHLVCGTLVRVSGLREGKAAAGLTNGCLAVVLVDKGERVNVAVIGGFEDRYGRLPRQMLTRVDLADVLQRDEIPWP